MDAAFVKRVAQERVDKELRGLKWNLEKVPENGSTESSPATQPRKLRAARVCLRISANVSSTRLYLTPGFHL